MTLDQYIEFIEKLGIAFGGTMLLIAIVLISIIGFAFIFTFLLDLARDCFHSEGQSK